LLQLQVWDPGVKHVFVCLFPAQAGSVVQQSLSQIRTVAAYNGQDRAVKEYDERLDEPVKVSASSWRQLAWCGNCLEAAYMVWQLLEGSLHGVAALGGSLHGVVTAWKQLTWCGSFEKAAYMVWQLWEAAYMV
jgi:hypothetical protein